MISAVVFDLDGVVVDTEQVWERERRAFVAEHGGSWPDDAQQRLMGMSTPEWAAYLSEQARVGLEPDAVAQEVVGRMAAAYRDALPLLPGAVDAVRRVSARWPAAVASSSPRSLIDTVLDAAGITDCFGATVSSEEVERGKPAPDVYLEAARRLGVDPTACAAVEDSSNGLRSAAAAGMRVIAVPHPAYPPAADALALAAVTLEDVSGLTVELVESLQS
jgi:HAD superfamily hydrolase (TIGR01509 family)